MIPGAAEIGEIVARSGLAGPLADPSQQTAFAFVAREGERFKVVAYASADAARAQEDLLRGTGPLFPLCLGRAENCLVYEYVDGAAGGAGIGEAIGSFLAALAEFPSPPVTRKDFWAWCGTLEAAGIFFGSTARALRTYLDRALDRPMTWNLEHMDAVPKNFIRTAEGKVRCIDPKHVHSGPRGAALEKLRANVGEYCRREDYEAIESAYRRRVRAEELDDPSYREFLLLFYALRFLVINAGRFSRRVNVENSMNRVRRSVILRVTGVPFPLRAAEELRWKSLGAAAFLARLPGRVVRRVRRSAGAAEPAR